ncbi:LLM class F420-dependent oxidoreductase [Actinocrinis puniceicyclus]|uniref:LLM class F420-dependent oxidoreductase n=1 Tax=Actinocrinis puniceicyclus TaxID=977794 RepID=A0A8J8BC81_9ACTN|nr:LLM class F420-dependent oxidoreductase [Actinocrinis puniceicyclus]MBS2963863.1 LLM class F420-dependent oxidoreductase [Actinocrinis puniceicyclus]
MSGAPQEAARRGAAPGPAVVAPVPPRRARPARVAERPAPSPAPTPAQLGVLVGARADGDPAQELRIARLADELGFGEVMVGEATGHDAFALGAALGSGPAALCLGPLPAGVRDPVTIARGAASVAALTGRSVGVALAASTSAVVEEWHGRARGVPATVVAESASVLRGPRRDSGLLAGMPVDFTGALVRTRGFVCALPPSNADLSVLAFGAELTEVAVARADRLVVPIGTVEHLARLRGRIQLAAERAGRQAPRLAVWVPVAVDPEEDTRRDMLRALMPYVRAAGFAGMFTEAGFGEVVRLARSGAHVRSVVAAAPPEMLDSVAAVGSVATVLAALGEYRAVGVDDVLLIPHNAEALTALAAE